MSNYRRNFVESGSFFFTVNLADRRSGLLVDRIDLVRHAFRYTKSRHPFTINAIVVLPDHLLKRERGIWQRRYWEHTLRDEEDFGRHCDYIHFNPVKHGHVESAIDWPYSSFRRFVRRGLYSADWGGVIGLEETAFGERAGR